MKGVSRRAVIAVRAAHVVPMRVTERARVRGVRPGPHPLLRTDPALGVSLPGALEAAAPWGCIGVAGSLKLPAGVVTLPAIGRETPVGLPIPSHRSTSSRCAHPRGTSTKCGRSSSGPTSESRHSPKTSPGFTSSTSRGHCLDPTGDSTASSSPGNQIHLNARGYAAWAPVIRASLQSLFRGPSEAPRVGP